MQLLLLHLKKHYLLLIFWILLTGCVLNVIGSRFGLTYLFLDPEYLGQVSFLSFFFVGLAFGGFVITWNITSYILNSYRFPFLATLRRPFSKYCLNNFLLPLIFTGIYSAAVILFREASQTTTLEVLIELSGFYSGLILVLLLTFTYFFQTNKDLFQILGLESLDPTDIPRELRPVEDDTPHAHFTDPWRVDNYLAHPFKTRLVRSTRHYNAEMLIAVFRQNHTNALIIESIALLTLIGLSFLIDYPVFLIPAAASVLLLFSVLIMLAGALGFWLRGWRTFFIVMLIIGVNYMMKFDWLSYENQAYGIDYNKSPTPYTYDTLQALNSPAQIKIDKRHGLDMLNNWKAKFNTPATQGQKPKMIILSVSGGGLRSALWTMRVLQRADSILDGRLMDHTVLIAGASGGILGSAYYRELFYQKQQGREINLLSPEYTDNMAKDLLNAITFTIAVNDLFYPFHRFEYAGKNYPIDRGYAFEMQLNKNTGHVLDKPLSAYTEAEFRMEIPMMILSPVIINDARSLYISSQPIAYLGRHLVTQSATYQPEIDGVELTKLLKGHDPLGLRFTTALRMSATFPYITPNVSLPTRPKLEVMDAGMRDNFGIELGVRLLRVFKDWIRLNTSGVIFVQIRDIPQVYPIKSKERQTVMDRLLNPIGNFYVNWQEYQDFYHDHLLATTKDWFAGNMEVVSFQYFSGDPEKRAALSWHLTAWEKRDILRAIELPHNKENLQLLKEQVKGE